MSPSLEVSHLASSTSFYAAILQPLGLHFIAPPEEERGTVAKLPSTSAFGQDEDDVFLELQQSENPLKPPKLSSIIISAPSPSAIAGLHSAWRKADPPLWSKFRDRRGLEKHFDDLELARSGPWQANDPRSGAVVTRAVVYDLDGNRCEVIHQQGHHRHQPPRILDWTYDVESAPIHTASNRISLRKNSNSGSQRPAVMPSSHHESPFSGGGRSAYAPAATLNAPEESASPRQSSRQGGLNTTTVVGALLGVAAGAALTYGFVSSNSRDSSTEAPERHRAPPRRATFPEKPVSSSRHHHQSYHENGIMPVDNYRDHKTPRKLAYPDFQGLSIRGGGYGDGDDDDDADADYAKNPWLDARSASYLTQGPPPAQSVITKSRPPSTFRPTDDSREPRSRPSSRSQGRSSTVRARSEAPRERVSTRVADEYGRAGQKSHRSVVGETIARPREPAAGPARSTVSRSRRSSVYHNPEHDTFVTAPTHRSSGTSRHHDYEYGGRETLSRSRAPSQVSTSTVRERARAPASHAAVSRTSARKVPLPRSGVGSSHAPWEARDIPLPISGVGSSYANWDDDLESVAPSDSISCVGSKHSRRTRRYHH